MREPDAFERFLRRHRIFRDLGHQCNILACGQAGDKIVELENEAHMIAPESR